MCCADKERPDNTEYDPPCGDPEATPAFVSPDRTVNQFRSISTSQTTPYAWAVYLAGCESQEKHRADERTRNSELISLRVDSCVKL
jgi:hypothetical protein